MKPYRDDPALAAQVAESSRWLFRRLMEAEAIKLEAAARELAKEEAMKLSEITGTPTLAKTCPKCKGRLWRTGQGWACDKCNYFELAQGR